MQKITLFLWFDDQAEEAANFYASIFKNSKVGKITRYEEESAKATGRPAGTANNVAFEIEGQKFTTLNGGPPFKVTEAGTLVVGGGEAEERDYFCGKVSTPGGGRSR